MAHKVRRWTEFFHATYESQPAFCLAQFFEPNAQFVQEISTRTLALQLLRDWKEKMRRIARAAPQCDFQLECLATIP